MWKIIDHKNPDSGTLVLTRDKYKRLKLAKRYWDNNGSESWEDEHGSFIDGDFDPIRYMEIPE